MRFIVIGVFFFEGHWGNWVFLLTNETSCFNRSGTLFCSCSWLYIMSQNDCCFMCIYFLMNTITYNYTILLLQWISMEIRAYLHFDMPLHQKYGIKIHRSALSRNNTMDVMILVRVRPFANTSLSRQYIMALLWIHCAIVPMIWQRYSAWTP